MSHDMRPNPGPVSRTLISLVLAGKYPARVERIAHRVRVAYGQVECPFLAQTITFAACVEHHTRAAPTSSPFAMRHWRACQGCAHNRRKP